MARLVSTLNPSESVEIDPFGGYPFLWIDVWETVWFRRFSDDQRKKDPYTFADVCVFSRDPSQPIGFRYGVAAPSDAAAWKKHLPYGASVVLEQRKSP